MHNKLQARLLLDSTLENLNSHKLIPTPDNYRVWFEYAAGSNDDLSAEIEAHLANNEPITDALCGQWHTRHLATSDQREVDDTRIAIGGMLNVMIQHLKDWDSSSTHFCDSLNDCMAKLDNDPSLDEVKNIVFTVTEEAKKVRNANFNIKATLHNLSDEVSALRQDIDRIGSEALTDALTQVSNRRGFDVSIKDITEKAKLEGFDCALMVVDIDHFKLVNDNFGHQVGDKILKYVATTIRKNIRGSDVLARYGGEEFAIILPYTNYEGATRVAENLRTAVAQRQLTTGSNSQTIGRITVSAGISIYEKGESVESFFDRADRCMYQAKNNGRDQIVGQMNQP